MARCQQVHCLSGGATIDVQEVMDVLPLSSSPSTSKREISLEGEALSLRKMVEDFERDVLVQGYREVGGNVSKLARKLKIDRANLHRKLKTYGIK